MTTHFEALDPFLEKMVLAKVLLSEVAVESGGVRIKVQNLVHVVLIVEVMVDMYLVDVSLCRTRD